MRVKQRIVTFVIHAAACAGSTCRILQGESLEERPEPAEQH